MASVRLTRDLRQQISQKAMNAFQISNPEPMPSTEFVQYLVEAIPRMPSQIGLRKMHDIYESEVKDSSSFDSKNAAIISKTVERLTIEWVDDAFDRRKYVAFDPSIPINVYRTDSHSYYMSFKATIEDFATQDKTKVQEYATDLAERRKKNTEAESDYRHKVSDLLDRCNTLKQLLEVWPAAENLIPQGYIVKMHEKVTRRQRAQQVKEDIDFNADEINQVVLTAKLMGA